MDLNKPITSTKNNYGLTSLVGGILQICFGFSTGIVQLGIFALTLFAGIKSIRSAEEDASRKQKAKIGIGLAVFATLLHFVFGFGGLVQPLFDSLL